MKVTEKEIEVMFEDKFQEHLKNKHILNEREGFCYKRGLIDAYSKQAQSMNESQSRDKEHLMWQTLHTLRLQVPNEISDVVFNSVVECFKEKGILELDPDDLPPAPQT